MENVPSAARPLPAFGVYNLSFSEKSRWTEKESQASLKISYIYAVITMRRVLSLCILFLLCFDSAAAQKSYYITNSGITLGAGFGKANQNSDLANSDGYGLDFTIGSELIKKDNALLGLDWKFRFLTGENKAYDHRINTDYTYSNILYTFNSYDLELGLTLNRLKKQTRIILGAFAGAGITTGQTSTDLYDASNNLYDFSSIDPNRDKDLVYNDLVDLSDGSFETALTQNTGTPGLSLNDCKFLHALDI